MVEDVSVMLAQRAGEWGELETGRRAKFYALTKAGRDGFTIEKRNWKRVFTAMNQVLAEEL